MHTNACFHVCMENPVLSFVPASHMKAQHQRILFFIFLEAPEIVNPPNNQVVMEQSPAAFVCEATGSPKPRIIWKKNGREVMITNFSKFYL